MHTAIHFWISSSSARATVEGKRFASQRHRRVHLASKTKHPRNRASNAQYITGLAAAVQAMPTRQQSALGRLLLAGLAVLTIVAGWARYNNAKRRTTTTRIPPFSTLPAHFAPPEKTRWGRGSRAPYPTGAYWLNAALGDVPVPATPYQVLSLIHI